MPVVVTDREGVRVEFLHGDSFGVDEGFLSVYSETGEVSVFNAQAWQYAATFEQKPAFDPPSQELTEYIDSIFAGRATQHFTPVKAPSQNAELFQVYRPLDDDTLTLDPKSFKEYVVKPLLQKLVEQIYDRHQGAELVFTASRVPYDARWGGVAAAGVRWLIDYDYETHSDRLIIDTNVGKPLL